MKRAFFILTAVLLLAGCRKETEAGPVDIDPVISIGGVSGGRIDEGADFCETRVISVQSNCDWSSTCLDDWIIVSPTSGKAGQFYEVSVRFRNCNLSESGRNATVSFSARFKGKAVEEIIKVSQRGYNPVDFGFDDTSTLTDGHPLLLASAKDFAAMRNLVASNREIRVIHDYVMRYADVALTLAPVEYKLEGIRLLNVSAEAFKRLFYLSYAYRVTGNPKYAERAGTELVTICNFKDWHPEHFLDDAELMIAAAIAYDWCYPRLSQQTRELARESIAVKGLNEYLYTWAGAVNNWNQVCNACALEALFAIEKEYPSLVEPVTQKAINLLPVAMKGYAPDGTYIEGPGYWNYGTSFNVIALDALQRRYGDTRGLLEQCPEFLRTSSYIDACITPSFRVFTYSDQAFPAQVSIVPFYMFDLTSDPSYLYSVGQMLHRGILNYQHCRHERLIPAAVIFAARKGVANPVKPSTRSFIGDGETPMASFRGSWDDMNASYIGMKLGHVSCGHGHMDIGTFVFESGGVQWATDLGGEVYNNLEKEGVDLWNMGPGSERWTVLRCALRGHNCIAFDNFDQIADVTQGTAVRGDFVTKNEKDQKAKADLSPLYADQVNSVTRTISLEDGTIGVIEDCIGTGDAERTLRWNMCTEAVQIKTDAKGATLHSADGQTLRLEVSGISGFTMKTWPATPVRSCESANTQIFTGFEVKLKKNSTYKYTVKLIPQK